MNLFTPFWKRELDIEDINKVSEILASSNVDVTDFEAYARGSGKQEHDMLQASFHKQGIFGFQPISLAMNFCSAENISPT